jgi:hypothetical protein
MIEIMLVVLVGSILIMMVSTTFDAIKYNVIPMFMVFATAACVTFFVLTFCIYYL